MGMFDHSSRRAFVRSSTDVRQEGLAIKVHVRVKAGVPILLDNIVYKVSHKSEYTSHIFENILLYLFM